MKNKIEITAELYSKINKIINGTINQRFNNLKNKEDVKQDVWTFIIEQNNNGKLEKILDKGLSTAIYNRILNIIRDESALKRQLHSTDELENKYSEYSFDLDIQETNEKQVREDQINAVMSIVTEKLSETAVKVAELMFKGMEVDEIASELNISLSIVYRHVKAISKVCKKEIKLV